MTNFFPATKISTNLLNRLQKFQVLDFQDLATLDIKSSVSSVAAVDFFADMAPVISETPTFDPTKVRFYKTPFRPKSKNRKEIYKQQ
jgi:hypothetical protein